MTPELQQQLEATSQSGLSVESPEVIRALQQYRLDRERGVKPDRLELLARYPSIVNELSACLDALDFVGEASPHLAATSLEAPAGLGQEVFPEAPLGDYRLIREIGRGGMGVVYEAMQLSLGRRVALKVLPFAATLDPKQLLRFKNEAQSAGQLHHTNIVPVYAVGCERGVHYYAMQFIEGQTLAALIEQLRAQTGLDAGAPNKTIAWSSPADNRAAGDTAKPIAAETSTEHAGRDPGFFRMVVNWGIQAAQALEHAHQLGIIHRDIKPANMLVGGRGNLWITDFGLAHCQSQPGLTMTGDLVGTLRYMSPEQALANRVSIDHRTDIYSLGATLYELLTLKPAIPGNDRQELLRHIAFEEPRSPRRLNKAIPSELETIVLKALEKNPADRYATAQELADDLERFLKDEPIRARRPTLWLRAKKWSRRHKPVVWSAAVSLFALLVMALVGLAVNNALIKGERDEADKARSDAQHRLFEAKLAQAKASRWSGRAGRRFDAYAALTEAARLARELRLGPEAMQTLRNEAIACLALVDLRLDSKWEGYPAGTTLTGIAFDADMRHYARVDGAGNITVRRLADNKETVKITDTGAPPLPGRPDDWRTSMIFSPNGRFLASAGRFNDGDAPLRIWDLQGPKLIFKEAAAGGFERRIDFSPDSRVLAAALPDGSIALHDLLTTTTVKRFFLGTPIYSVRFHPRGDALAVAIGKQVHVVDLAGRPIVPPLSHPREPFVLSWSADGRRLAVACASGQAFIWNAASGRRLATWIVDDFLTHVAFNQRGDLLATAGGDTTKLWDADGGKELLSTGGLASDFSRDDRWLGLGVYGAQVGRWEVASAGEYRPLYGHRGTPVFSLDISPDGRLLASAGKDAVHLWDVVAGKRVASLPTGITYSAIFDRGGKFLITSGNMGAYRWPIRTLTETHLPRQKLGPPQPILAPQTRPQNHAALSADGRTFAARTTYSAAVILDLTRPHEKPRFISPAQRLSLSPDGKWLASTVDDTFASKVWDVRSGKCVKDFPGMRNAEVTFSPDNRWLVFATGREYVFHRIGTWEPHVRLPRDSAGYHYGPIAFSLDAKTAAIAHTPRVIRLIDCEHGRTLADFEAPATEYVTALCFTPDGSRLMAGTANGMIQLWDLRRIREQLRELSLDWDPSSALPEKADDTKLLHAELDLGDFLDREKYSLILVFFPLHAEAYYKRGLAHLRFEKGQAAAVQDFNMALALRPNFADAYWQRGLAYGALGQAQQAIADYCKFLDLLPPGDRRRAEVLVRRAGNYQRLNQNAKALADLLEFTQQEHEIPVDLLPTGATLCNNQAWQMVADPSKLREPTKALPLAKKAVELLPEQATYWNTLGVVYYRLGKFSESVAALERSLRTGKGQADAFDLYFLAMCHFQLGDVTKARQSFDQAVRWAREHQGKLPAVWNQELKDFRIEAAEVLELKGPVRD